MLWGKHQNMYHGEAALLDASSVFAIFHDFQLDLKRKLAPLKERLKLFRNAKQTCLQTEHFIKVRNIINYSL